MYVIQNRHGNIIKNKDVYKEYIEDYWKMANLIYRGISIKCIWYKSYSYLFTFTGKKSNFKYYIIILKLSIKWLEL